MSRPPGIARTWQQWIKTLHKPICERRGKGISPGNIEQPSPPPVPSLPAVVISNHFWYVFVLLQLKFICNSSCFRHIKSYSWGSLILSMRCHIFFFFINKALGRYYWFWLCSCWEICYKGSRKPLLNTMHLKISSSILYNRQKNKQQQKAKQHESELVNLA